MSALMDDNLYYQQRINDLTAQVVAAELHLTFFASRNGKDCEMYKDSLKDFATAWYLLKKNRAENEFLKEVILDTP